MDLSRRQFLKTAALAGAAATLPGCLHQGFVPANGKFPAAPNFHTSPQASVMISGGTITKDGKFTDAVRAAHRLHYGDRKKILLILHATEPEKRDLDERKLRVLFADDNFEVESLHHWQGDEALEKIRTAEAFFVGGGETFLLLRTLIETGQLGLIRERVLAGVPYNGSSAGSNVAGPVIGTTNDFPVVDVPTRAAFGIFPAVVNPHHPTVTEPDYGGRVNKILIYTRLNPAETVIGIGNAAVARLHQGRVTIEVGPAFYYHAGEHHPLPEGFSPELTALVHPA
ncbi:MAG: Type 1 glutamine amidotransferase-like domain-containing protein [Verrucomicrobia bacterium]|nr:Type 1 glutamine amidotransferase-like domain-containing protein [Verrucomicrobiota bacterium]